MSIEENVSNERVAAELMVRATHLEIDIAATAKWMRCAAKRLMPPPETPNTNNASHHSG